MVHIIEIIIKYLHSETYWIEKLKEEGEDEYYYDDY